MILDAALVGAGWLLPVPLPPAAAGIAAAAGLKAATAVATVAPAAGPTLPTSRLAR